MNTTENNKEKIFQQEHPSQREQVIAANSFAIEQQVVRREFSPEELENYRRELSDLSIDLKNKREAAALRMKEIREEVRLAQEAVNDRVVKLKTRYEENLEKVYLFDDQESRRMRIYNKHGELVNERPLLPAERQTRIVNMPKDGTNG